MTAKPNIDAMDLQLVVTADNWLDQLNLTATAGHAIGVALSTEQALDELYTSTVISAAFDLVNKFERIQDAIKIGRLCEAEPTIDGRIFDKIGCIADCGQAVGLTMTTEQVAKTLNPDLLGSIAYDLALKFKEVEQLLEQGLRARKPDSEDATP